MALPSFAVDGVLMDVLANAGAGDLVESALTQATIMFDCNIDSDTPVIYENTIYRVNPIPARVDSDGNIVGIDGDPVLLLANDDDLNVTGIQWRVNVSVAASVIPPLPSGRLRSWWFDAGSDGNTLDLATVTPVPGTAAHGTSGGELTLTELEDLLDDDGSGLRSILDALYGTEKDEYHEYANFAAFPVTGTADRIYVALDTGKFFRWTGSAYSQVGQTGVEINIKDYGATGDGIADDTAEIQAAFTAAAANLGTVRMPKGTYLISSTLNLPTGVVLKGAGPLTTIKTNSAITMLNVGTPSGAWPLVGRVSDFILDGQDVATAGMVLQEVVVSAGFSQITTRNIDGAAYTMDGSQNSTFELVDNDGCDIGWRVLNGSSTNHWRRCENADTGSMGIFFGLDPSLPGYALNLWTGGVGAGQSNHMDTVIVEYGTPTIQFKMESGLNNTFTNLILSGYGNAACQNLINIESDAVATHFEKLQLSGDATLDMAIVNDGYMTTIEEPYGVITGLGAGVIMQTSNYALVERPLWNTATIEYTGVGNAVSQVQVVPWPYQQYGTTAARPFFGNACSPFYYYDTDLGHVIWWNGTAWQIDEFPEARDVDWVGRNPGIHTVPVGQTTYYDKADTAYASLPSTLDTGQTITYSDSGSTNNQPVISDGGFRLTRGSGSGSSFMYANLDAGSGHTLTRMGMRFKIDNTGASTHTWSLGMALTNGNGVLAGGTAYRIGVHLVLGRDSVGISKVSNATGSFVFDYFGGAGLVNLDSQLVADNVTEYTMEMWRDGTTLVVILPDKQRISITDTDIGTWSTQYGFFEPVIVARTTDDIPVITDVWYDIDAQVPPGDQGVLTRRDLSPYAKKIGETLVTPTIVVYDDQLYIYDHADATKLGQFDLASITTGNARTVQWPDANGQMALKADLIPAFTTTATAAGTTTLLSTSSPTQRFTGVTTQIVSLPTTGVVAGQSFVILNDSTGIVTVNSSGGNLVNAVAAGSWIVVTANAATPTTDAHWTLRDVVDLNSVQSLFGKTLVLPAIVVYDNQLYMYDNADGTKLGQFEMSTITTGNTRTVSWPDANGTMALTSDTTTAATASKGVGRDASGNAFADNFIGTGTTTAMAAGTTTLTVDSTFYQQFTGSGSQTVKMPTTSVAFGLGMIVANVGTGSIALQGSDASSIGSILAGQAVWLIANQATPVTSAHWMYGALSGQPPRMTSQTNSIAQRDAQANLLADAFIPGFTSTATAAGTTTLTVDSTEIQYFTGSTTQIVALPTTSVVAGQRYTIQNNSTGAVTVNSSGANLVGGISTGRTITVTALQAAPTTAAHWYYEYGLTVSDSTASSAGSIPRRDSQSNLLADAFIPGYTSTVTSGSTVTLTVDSTEVQNFTGSTAQTVTLPTTNIAAGQRYTIINNNTSNNLTVNASGGAAVATVGPNLAIVVTSLQATPTLAAHWSALYMTASAYTTSAGSLSIARRDTQSNLLADAFIPGFATTATAAATTTLTVDSVEIQEFTGATTQTCVLPTTVVAGQRFNIINNSTGTVTVQSSGLNTILSLLAGVRGTFTALVATPTTAANWSAESGIAASITTGNGSSSLALRTSNGLLNATAFVPSLTSTTTAAGTTTLTAASTQKQLFTGATTQTVTLPTTSVASGQEFEIINTSSGAITVNASDATLVKTVAAGASSRITSLQATPTTNTHWYATV